MRDGFFTFVVILYCCYRKFTLPRGAMSWPVVCDCGIFGHTRLLLDQTFWTGLKYFCLVSNISHCQGPSDTCIERDLPL